MAFSRADEYERRKWAKERAAEIHSGFCSGMFERDELVLEELRKLSDE